MRIKGKLCIKELKSFLIALGFAFAAGLFVYGFFALLSLVSWALCLDGYFRCTCASGILDYTILTRRNCYY